MKIAVILSTYNSPDRLKPTLIGYVAQSYRDFEMIVADDGSTDATRQLIRGLVNQYGMPIKHVWQEDQGFRKCRILNQAIASTTADYLIFSDGDCIPRQDFVAVHAKLAKPGRFLSGGYIKLSAETSKRIADEDVLAGRSTDARWLIDNGMRHTSKVGRLAMSQWQAQVMNAITPTRPTWNGHNSSGWRQDALKVNGFDERMAYWAQDREFGERLDNAGVRGIQIRYSALCVHLDHARPYKTQESRERNKQIRRDTRRNKTTWTAYGLVHSPPPAEQSPLHAAPAQDVDVMHYRMA